MIELMDAQKELGLAGESHLREDSVYRSTYLPFVRDRLTVKDPLKRQDGFGYELRRTPNVGREFDDLQPYLELLKEEDDETFVRRALEMVDLDQLLRYVLFVQACGLTDNFHNNLFIWADKTGEGLRYAFYPWDLDLSWGRHAEAIDEESSRWMPYPLTDRLINLDAGGARSRLAQIWKEMRESIFIQENVAMLLEQYANELSESGAMMRNEMRWNMGMSYPDGYEILEFAGSRFTALDGIIAQIAETEGSIAFLEMEYTKTMDEAKK